MYEYYVVLVDGTSKKIIAENVASVLTNFNEEEQTIINIVRNGEVTVTASSNSNAD